MQVVILAGGLATRLGPLAENTPKSLMMIDNRPFLGHQLDLLKEKGIEDVVLCVGHLGDQIEAYAKDGKEWNMRIRYSHEEGELLGTGGCIQKALPLLNDAFFVTYGDSYLMLDYQDIQTSYEQEPDTGLMVVYKNDNQLDQSNVVFENGLVTYYGKESQDPLVYIDEGLSILHKDAFAPFKEREKFSLGEVFQTLIQQQKLRGYETTQRFFEIGSPKGLEELQEVMQNKRNKTS